MKRKTIVRIVVKLLGVYLIAMGLPQAASSFSNMLVQIVANPNANSTAFGGGFFDWQWMVPNTMYLIAQIGVGVYLLFGGQFIINLIVPSNQTYCPECGYMLRKPIGAHCVECGAALPNEIVLQVNGHGNDATP
jgi:hypothetical protein